MYHVELSKKAAKEQKRLAKNYRQKVLSALILLQKDPFLGEKMEGKFKGHYRVKIPPIRIIYTIDHKSKIIYITALGHRGDIYK